MSTETTHLLNGFVINIPKQKDVLLENYAFQGLSLEELMPYENDPWWLNVRKFFMLVFWTSLIVIFVAACIISIMEHGSCQIGYTTVDSILTESTVLSKYINQTSEIFATHKI